MRDPLTPVYAVACADYSPERCRAAVAELADRFPALRDTQPGARVLVKANLVTAMRPEKAALVPVIGDHAPFRAPDFDTASADAGMEHFLADRGLSGVLNRAAKDILAVRPRLDAKKCVGCG